jgi:hypothetical protein
MNVAKKKKIYFFLSRRVRLAGTSHPSSMQRIVMDIRGLAERTESCHFKFIFSFNPDLYSYTVPRSVDRIKSAIKVEYKIKMNEKRSEKIKKKYFLVPRSGT